MCRCLDFVVADSRVAHHCELSEVQQVRALLLERGLQGVMYLGGAGVKATWAGCEFGCSEMHQVIK